MNLLAFTSIVINIVLIILLIKQICADVPAMTERPSAPFATEPPLPHALHDWEAEYNNYMRETSDGNCRRGLPLTSFIAERVIGVPIIVDNIHFE